MKSMLLFVHVGEGVERIHRRCPLPLLPVLRQPPLQRSQVLILHNVVGLVIEHFHLIPVSIVFTSRLVYAFFIHIF